MASGPRAVYLARLQTLRGEIARLSRDEARYAAARLVTAGVAALVLWLALGAGRLSAWWLVLPGGVFLALVVGHDRAIRRRDAAARAVAFYERGLARVEDRWIGTGDTGERFLDPEHLYAADLDVFGRGSLFELLSVVRTEAGEETLAGWLTRPAPPGAIDERQRAVEELRPRLDLREDLASAGTDVRAQVKTPALVAWATAPAALRGGWPRVVAPVLAALTVGAGIWWMSTGDGAAFLLGGLAAEMAFSGLFRRRVRRVVHAAGEPARELTVLAAALARVEQEPFAAPRLVALRDGLATGGIAASAAVARLQRLVAWHDWQHNQFFAPLAALLLWSTQIAWAIEAWRREHGEHVAAWTRSLGEIEALASLACYAYEHPDQPFADVLEPGAPGTFDAEDLAHPLLPRATAVPNSLRLEARREDEGAPEGRVPAPALCIVSGSNMSGKSTLLRAVGLNAVLALAGAPVCARRLRLSPLAVGGTIRIQDSLHAGRSRFYAEIVRLRCIVDQLDGPLPVMFLLDELLFGTNSHDRAVGAEYVLATLASRGGIGLVTTHDLAVTAIADRLGRAAANVHFEDRLDEGTLTFDYVMRPGPVRRGNAIALMRAVGLHMTTDEEPQHERT